ncbi:TIGR02678 family protein [Kineosporia rhizophila]|uniref:TIGR02678 family protein n=1 Tax=Kineosporia rhizophila TaxID=84633 RepID=UPI001E3229E0|nr:TIGR02678 family protein [Kineosporia rhizophila]
MSKLHNQLAGAEQDEVARGVRLLLRNPLITQRTDQPAFDLVRRRQAPLQKWFDHHCGWTVLVEPRLGYARLVKVGVRGDATRPARRPRSGRQPFDRRRYVLLCLVAAELLNTPVTTIGLLADRVTQACALDEAVGAFDSSRQAERRALVDVLRLLERFGAVTAVDGATDSYLEGRAAKVLYEVDVTLLIRLMSAPRGASTLAVPAGQVPARFEELLRSLVAETRYGTGTSEGGEVSAVQRNLWLRHSILRLMFDEPVVYRRDLSAEQLDYLASPTGRQILRRAAEQAGFVLEERAEGYLLVDPDAIATDETFPEGTSHAKVTALRLLDELQPPGRTRSTAELTAVTRQVLADFPGWAMSYRGDAGPQALTAQAVQLLADFGLAEQTGGLVTSLPAAARYVVELTAPESERTPT